MKLFDLAYSLSTENHGILTAYEARRNGIGSKELARWVKSGRMVKAGRGVYKTTQYPMSDEDPYAIAVAESGQGAYLCGESVLGLLRLMPVNANYIHVCIPRRIRRRLPREYVATVARKGESPVNIHGIMCQKPADAIRSCIGTHMGDRLTDAAGEAYRIGQISKEEMEQIQREIANGQ